MIEYLFNVITICEDDKIRFVSEVVDSKELVDEKYLFLTHDSMTHRDYYCLADQYVDMYGNELRIKAFMEMLNIKY